MALLFALTLSLGAQHGSVLISLERTACFGECPIYRVTLDGNGAVTYDGTTNVRVVGHQTARIPAAQVRSILQTAERINFFGLRDQYRVIRADGTISMSTDRPTTYVTITTNGRTKRVEDYYGTPDALKDLEKQIDDAAGTIRWVRIDAKTLQGMIDSGAPPSDNERNELLRHAVEHDDVPVIKALLDMGADANLSLFTTHTPVLMLVRSAAAARLILAAGANPFTENDNGYSPLSQAPYLEPGVIEALLAAGVRPDAQDRYGMMPLYLAACNGNAGAVAALLKAGADPAVQFHGKTPLVCAKEAQGSDRQSPASFKPPFPRDFDQTIALLEKAQTKQRR